MGGEAFRRIPFKENLAFGRFINSGQNIKKGRLPGSIRANQTDKFPIIDLQRNISQRAGDSA